MLKALPEAMGVLVPVVHPDGHAPGQHATDVGHPAAVCSGQRLDVLDHFQPGSNVPLPTGPLPP